MRPRDAREKVLTDPPHLAPKHPVELPLGVQRICVILPVEEQSNHDVPGDVPGYNAVPGDVPGYNDVPGDVPGYNDVSDDDVPGNLVPGDDVPGYKVPGDDVPGYKVPGDDVFGQGKTEKEPRDELLGFVEPYDAAVPEEPEQPFELMDELHSV